MTQPAPETLEREWSTAYVTDVELIRWLGVPEKIARLTIKALDANPISGFPPKRKQWGNRRNRLALEAYFEATEGVKSGFGAARSAAESRARTRLPRRHPAEASSGEATP